MWAVLVNYMALSVLFIRFIKYIFNAACTLLHYTPLNNMELQEKSLYWLFYGSVQ